MTEHAASTAQNQAISVIKTGVVGNMLYRVEVNSVSSADDEDRYLRILMDHPEGDAAEQRSFESAPAVRADHDHINA